MTNAAQLSLLDIGPAALDLAAVRLAGIAEKVAEERFDCDPNADEGRDLDP
jgi:hypothetical protein